MSATVRAQANSLLAALPPAELERLEPHLQVTGLENGQVLCKSTRPARHVYFPTTALVSLLYHTPSGEGIDVAVTGAEGMVGLPFGLPWSTGQAVVQCAGEALSLPVSVMQEEFARGGSLQWMALRYGQLLLAQVAQTALCNRLHRIDQQLARWILTSLDRSESGERLNVTQAQVAKMLGVRREGVSSAVRKLEAAGVLYWGRGRLKVTDRARLKSHCCECYDALRALAQRLEALTPPAD